VRYFKNVVPVHLNQQIEDNPLVIGQERWEAVLSPAISAALLRGKQW
jgi:hypothetical protein